MKLNKLKSLDEFLFESEQANKGKYVVSYSGKFQPFHNGHYDIYIQLVKKFGKDNVYITTADLNQKKVGKSDYDDNHFLSFDEKKDIMTSIFKIPAKNVVQIKNPYNPQELLTKFSEDTVYISVLGSKDATRLANGKYFEMYTPDANKGYKEAGYVYPQDNSAGINQSATDVRNMFRSDISDKEKEKEFKKFYGGKFDKKIFDLLNTKLNATVSESAIFECSQIENSKNFRPWAHPLHPQFAEFVKESHKRYLKHTYAINEGGAFGHLSHVYEDYDLSFGQLKEIVTLALSGKLENAVEKTDGVALAISYKDGKLVTARNKGEYRNAGENAADINRLKEKFAGRGELTDAYSFAIDDLESAISKLKKSDLDDIFANGAKFMHLEVMYAPSLITIPYNVNLLVFHNVTEYNLAGNPIAQDRTASDKLAKMIKDVNQDVQKTYKIQGSPYIKYKDGLDFEKEKTTFIGKIDKIQKQWGLSDNDTLYDYYYKQWEKLLKAEGIELDEMQIKGVIDRLTGISKSFRLNSKTIPDKDTLDAVTNFEKTKVKPNLKEIKYSLETIFIQLGLVIMKSLQKLLAANPDEATAKIKVELDKNIKELQQPGNESTLSKLETHLKRLEQMGGMDAVFPSEGIVFNYKGGLYKLTGSFADVHHIVSAFRFGR